MLTVYSCCFGRGNTSEDPLRDGWMFTVHIYMPFQNERCSDVDYIHAVSDVATLQKTY